MIKLTILFAFFAFLNTYPFNSYYSNLDTLPSDFPKIKVKVNTSPTPGNIYLSNFVLSQGTENTPYLMILNNQGEPRFYRKLTAPVNTDFKVQPNGLLTYYDVGKAAFYAMNQNYEVVDSFRAITDWLTDEHELRILPNGHYLLLAGQLKQVDMSVIVPNGKKNAMVTFMSIQEFDENKNLAFIWKTEDYFQITDGVGLDLTSPYIDYAHCNAIDIDTDGNILMSIRHFDEIVKINRNTGAIIWRMGGKKCVNNQFVFPNDIVNGFYGFSHQHGVRRLSNGNILIYDNGNLKPVQYSRAVEYEINENTKIVRKIWEYRNDPDYYGSAMGFAQRLENGNTLIGWGLCDSAAVTEVTYAKEKVFELAFPTGIYSYRAFRFDFPPTSVKEDNIISNLNFNLYQNYPNPFNPTTVIEYAVSSNEYVASSNQYVVLKIYDVLGREIETLVNEQKPAGKYNIEWNASKYSSGIYYYELRAGSFQSVKKMILIK